MTWPSVPYEGGLVKTYTVVFDDPESGLRRRDTRVHEPTLAAKIRAVQAVGGHIFSVRLTRITPPKRGTS